MRLIFTITTLMLLCFVAYAAEMDESEIIKETSSMYKMAMIFKKTGDFALQENITELAKLSYSTAEKYFRKVLNNEPKLFGAYYIQQTLAGENIDVSDLLYDPIFVEFSKRFDINDNVTQQNYTQYSPQDYYPVGIRELGVTSYLHCLKYKTDNSCGFAIGLNSLVRFLQPMPHELLLPDNKEKSAYEIITEKYTLDPMKWN